VNPSSFGGGVTETLVLLYSVGVIQSMEEIAEPFEEIKDGVTSSLTNIQTTYVVVTAVVAFLFTACTCLVRL